MTLRPAAIMLAALLVAIPLAHVASAGHDGFTLAPYRTTASDGTPGDVLSREFRPGETVALRLTGETGSSSISLRERFLLYRVTGATTSYVGLVGDGGAVTLAPHTQVDVRFTWDQRHDGAQVPSGRYLLKLYDDGGHLLAEAGVDVGYNPDLHVRRVTTADEPVTPPGWWAEAEDAGVVAAEACVADVGLEQNVLQSFDVAWYWTDGRGLHLIERHTIHQGDERCDDGGWRSTLAWHAALAARDAPALPAEVVVLADPDNALIERDEANNRRGTEVRLLDH